MPALKIGIALAGLRLPFRQALHTAAELGADAVEIDARGEINPQDLSRTGIRQVRKLLEDHRLRVSAVAFRTRRGYDTTEELEPRIAATKAALELAYALGAPIVVNHIGRVPADRDGPTWRLLVEVLGELARHGNRVGALLAAETGTESGDDLARLLAELPEGTIGADLNPGNLLIHGFLPLEAVAALGPRVLHVHASDAVRELAPGRGRPVSVGQGAADYPALLAALDEWGYQGYFTLPEQAGDSPDELARAIRFLREL